MNFLRVAHLRLCTPHNNRLLSLSALRYTALTHQPIKTCPSCSTPLSSFLPVCPKCSNIFALAPQTTHHDIFGLPYDPNPFNVNVAMLKRRFREAQAVCHPDSWASRGSDKQDAAQALSSLVNNAYQTLLHPLSRAEYILARNQMSVSETDQVDDLEFMAEIMEAREIIEDADEPREVIRVVSENDEKIRMLIVDLEKLVEKQDWTAMKAATVRLRYLEGIDRAGRRWVDKH